MIGKRARAVLAGLLAFAMCRGGYMATGYRDRQVLVIEPKAGVDYTTSALDIDAGRASQMSNLIGENGMLRKRLGYEQLRQSSEGLEADNADLRGKRINGIWPLSGNPAGDGKMIVHAGTGLYLWWQGTFKAIETESAGVWHPVEMEDVRTDGIWKDGSLYIIGGGEIIVVEPEHYTDGLQTTVVRSIDRTPYVPTTTVGIADEDNPEAVKRTVLDDVNLMTPKRVNKMLGRVPGEDEFPSGSLDTTMPPVRYRLDGEPDTAQEIKVTIETEDENGDPYEIVLSTEHAHSSGDILYPVIGGEVVTSYASLGLIGDKGLISFSPDLLYKTVSGDLYTNEDWELIGEIERMLVQVDVGGDEKDALRLEPMVEGLDNITVEFSVPGEEDAVTRITGAGFGIVYGADGASDRLFLGGIPGYPGRVYYSGYDMHGVSDWSYWPANSYITCGSERAPVIAFSRLSDGCLAVHNAASGQEPTIRFVTGESVAEYEDEDKTVIRRYYPVFRVVAGNVGEPVVSRDACKDFYGDHLILTSTGVYAVVMKQNIQTADRHLTERSRSIRVKLGTMDLRDAAAVVYEGRYWLAVGDTVFLADSKHTYADGAGGMQYEWYQFDGIGARCFAVIGDELWFGTGNGRICRLHEKKDALKPAIMYTDETENIFRLGEVALDAGSTERLVASAARPDIAEADAIIFDEGLYQTLFGADEVLAFGGRVGLIDEERIADVHDGMIVYMDATGGGEVVIGDVDRGDGTFKLYEDEDMTVEVEPAAGARYLLAINGVELQIDKASIDWAPGGGERFSLLRFGKRIDVTAPTGGSGITMRGRVIWRRPVVAEWYSKVFDFGTNQLEKTLHRLTVSTEPVENGQVKVGFETRAAAGIYGSSGIGGLDLGELDFLDFTLVGFASSYTRMLMQRHVNFALFRFRSDEAAPCCIHNMTVLYTVVGSIRGGR